MKSIESQRLIAHLEDEDRERLTVHLEEWVRARGLGDTREERCGIALDLIEYLDHFVRDMEMEMRHEPVA